MVSHGALLQMEVSTTIDGGYMVGHGALR